MRTWWRWRAGGRPLEASHLTDIMLGVEPANPAALAASGGTNLSETMWLKSEIAAAKQKLGAKSA